MNTVSSPALNLRTKQCSRCGNVKPWREYHARTRWEDGTMRSPQGYCKICAREGLREWRQANPDQCRVLDARAHKNQRRDPERLAILRDQKRQGFRRRHEVPARHYRATRDHHSGGTELDPRPFAAWLTTLGTTAETIGRECGLEPSQVRKYLRCERMVRLDVVDRALLNANTIMRLDDLYEMED